MLPPPLTFLVDLLQQAPGVKALVTSRVVLNLSGEWIYLVNGLSYPPPALYESTPATPVMEDPGHYPAIRLFIDRARRVQANFSPEEEMAGIIQICQVVEGLPLALEMAAAWTKMMTCTAIAAEIQHRLTFLETRYRDIPARHRSVLAVINQSCQTLSPQERHVYTRLAVFKGGFQRQAAERVAGASVSILSALVDKSLLRWDADDRYQVHELLRQYVREELLADAEAKRITHHLHCMYFADFLEQHSAAITGPHQRDVLRSISAEHQNIRAAWQQAVEDANLRRAPKSGLHLLSILRFHQPMRRRR